MSSNDTDLVASVIQKGYQDATQTVLDRMVSEDIVEALRAAGWATPEEVRAIVAAAGGRVEVSLAVACDPPAQITRWRDVATGSTILVTSD